MAEEFEYKISIDDDDALAAFGRIAKKAEQTAKEAKDALGKIELGQQAREVEKAFAIVQKSGVASVRQLTKEELELKKALSLLGSTGQFEIEKIGDEAKKSGAEIGAIAGIVSALTTKFIDFGEKAVRAIVDVVKESVELAKVQVKAEAQLEQAIKSTGGAAGLTAEELKSLASELQSVTEFGDEAVIGSEALLLTFTKVGSETFPRAQKAILDLSTAMVQDLKTSTIQVGKALNDPVRGLDNLSKAGIQFTQSQKDVIKSLVEAGDVAGAQAAILQELERQFGGSAEAARKAGGGIQPFANAIGDLQEKIGLPVLQELGTQLEGILDILGNNQGAVDDIATALGTLAAAAVDFVGSNIVNVFC